MVMHFDLIRTRGGGYLSSSMDLFFVRYLQKSFML